MRERTIIRIFCIVISIICSAIGAFAYNDNYVVIRVAENDNLINISKVYLEDPANWREIARVNRLNNPDLIYPGQDLIIPVRLLKGVPLDGRVTFVKGDVLVQSQENGSWEELRLNDIVRQGTGIRTGVESALEITFENGTSFFLRSNTYLELRAASVKGDRDVTMRLYLKAGRTISRLKKALGIDSRYEIETPSAVTAARNTGFRVTVDENETTRMEVVQGIVGVNAMKVGVEVNEGEGTLVKKNMLPVKPKKLLPPPAPVHLLPLYRTMPIKFQFEHVEGAVMYRVMLARDEGFRDVVKEKIIEPGRSLEIVGVEDGRYFLQSRSIDGDGLEGLPSATVEIRVRVNPLPPFIQRPDDNAEFRDKIISFTWLNVRNAEGYHFQIAEDSGFENLVEDNDDLREVSYSSEVSDFKTYYYRVSSVAGDGYEGIWSDIQSFRVIPPPPAPPLEAPEVGENGIQLRWRNLGEGITYCFQMARDREFKKIIIDENLEKPEITLERPEEGGTYYVRTSAMDSEGYEGDFSLPQSFEIQPEIRYEALGIVGGMLLIFLLVP